MDRKVLERLLIDRSVGVLSADADALLSAYLSHDADASIQADRFDETVALAKEALQAYPSAALPAFPAQKLRRLGRRRTWLIVLRKLSTAAACVAFGFLLARTLFTGTGEVLSRSAPPLIERARTQITPEGFWSVRRWYEQAAHRQWRSGPRLIWDSPVKEPRLGDEI